MPARGYAISWLDEPPKASYLTVTAGAVLQTSPDIL
jgi:hypothetical protein